MLYSPLEQFEIIPLVNLGLFSFTNSALFVFITLLVSFILIECISIKKLFVPSRYQSLFEHVFKLILQMNRESIGEKSNSFFPFIFSIFVFVLFCNLLGLVPYSFTISSHLVITFNLALGIWISKLIIGFRLHGLKLLGMFLPQGIPFLMAPFFIVVELIGFIIPIISLSVRLFANLMSGHILLKVIFGFAWSMMLAGGILFLAHFIPLFILFLLLGLETGVAIIQAYVFTILTCIYFGNMIEGGH